ncbi:NADH-quinone oxidoreductase subunit C [Methanorbis furvi]|uniref:NAD(P)H-quinone oxidoreductase subunit J, chloroplastic n=1 Tax=Methanorbis furvi TaxID=3028299 RepID=A0AAE4MDX7_9EURY|nr:NAD(P)H-quinone oxidoreductase subunit J, chloroplastic [Methanocorpusculaceae archaeon Ag1]
MTDKILSPEEVTAQLTAALGSAILDTRIQRRAEGSKKIENINIWITIRRDAVHAAAEELMKIWYPHLSCIAGYDKGADSPDLRIQYIFSIYGGVARGEYMVIFSLDLPKNDARLPTLTDILEGAAFTEHEKTEYLGITIDGLAPAPHKFFLPQDFPNGVYPLRKDDKKIPDSMVKDLWACGRPVNRPPAPLDGGDE